MVGFSTRQNHVTHIFCSPFITCSRGGGAGDIFVSVGQRKVSTIDKSILLYHEIDCIRASCNSEIYDGSAEYFNKLWFSVQRIFILQESLPWKELRIFFS